MNYEDLSRQRSKLSDVTLEVYPDARHEVFNESNRDEVVADLVAWLDDRIATSAGRAGHAGTEAGAPETPGA